MARTRYSTEIAAWTNTAILTEQARLIRLLEETQPTSAGTRITRDLRDLDREMGERATFTRRHPGLVPPDAPLVVTEPAPGRRIEIRATEDLPLRRQRRGEVIARAYGNRQLGWKTESYWYDNTGFKCGFYSHVVPDRDRAVRGLICGLLQSLAADAPASQPETAYVDRQRTGGGDPQ